MSSISNYQEVVGKPTIFNSKRLTTHLASTMKITIGIPLLLIKTLELLLTFRRRRVLIVLLPSKKSSM